MSILEFTTDKELDLYHRKADLGYVDGELASKAPINSPTFTGTPTAPTPAQADDSTKIATTAHVKDNLFAANIANAPAGGIAAGDVQAALNELDTEKAPLASPAFTGNPTAPTPLAGDNDTSIATTAFVTTAVSAKADLASPAFTGNPTAPTPLAGDNDTSIATTAFVNTALRVLGMAYANYSAVATGTGTIPIDDTIPQNTEGNEFMSVTYNRKSATSILKISIVAYLSSSAATTQIIGALFQDTTANALAAQAFRADINTAPYFLTFTHLMVSGAAGDTTFKFRAGTNGAGTTTFCGRASVRDFGGITLSSIVVEEFAA